MAINFFCSSRHVSSSSLLLFLHSLNEKILLISDNAIKGPKESVHKGMLLSALSSAASHLIRLMRNVQNNGQGHVYSFAFFSLLFLCG